jgi:hypothetical protein
MARAQKKTPAEGAAMPRPIALSDDELQAVMDAARPLAPRDRDQFLRRIAAVITALPVRGPGVIHRAIRSTWREFYDVPDLRSDEPRSRAY